MYMVKLTVNRNQEYDQLESIAMTQHQILHSSQRRNVGISVVRICQGISGMTKIKTEAW